jgi:hypothetical protein
MTANAEIATVLGLIPASSDAVESEADEAVLKKIKIPKIPLKKNKHFTLTIYLEPF